jgi:hypothetical protein
MPFRINQHIFRLHISIDDILTVQIRQSQDHLSTVELGPFLIKFTSLLQVVKQLAAIDKIHYQV